MKRKLLFTCMTVVFFIFAFTITAMAADNFDTSQVAKGVIKVTANSNARMKVMIQKGSEKYTYDLPSGQTTSFPLQMGNGSYKVSLLENTGGTSYKLVAATDVNVNLNNPNDVYLNSIQSIDWAANKNSVAKAVALTKDAATPQAKAKKLWDYMIKSNSYDYNKLATLPSTYIPVPDMTLAQKTGICYDFSSLYAAMMRSEGIPTKLVKGYAPKDASGYHAWNEVYDSATGTWFVVDTTYDVQVYPKTHQATMAKSSADFQKVHQY